MTEVVEIGRPREQKGEGEGDGEGRGRGGILNFPILMNKFKISSPCQGI